MAEFGRIIEKDTTEIERRWKKLEEKILNLIEQEDDNERLQALLQSTGPTRDLPESKILVHIIMSVFGALYMYLERACAGARLI